MFKYNVYIVVLGGIFYFNSADLAINKFVNTSPTFSNHQGLNLSVQQYRFTTSIVRISKIMCTEKLFDLLSNTKLLIFVYIMYI